MICFCVKGQKGEKGEPGRPSNDTAIKNATMEAQISELQNIVAGLLGK